MRAIAAALLVSCFAVRAVIAADIGADLFDKTQATHKSVVYQGSWNDPSTWQPPQVPPAGSRVLVQCNSIVTIHQDTADIQWIYVDGVLMPCDHCDTQLNVHSVYVPMMGRMRWGMSDMPCKGKSIIEFVPGSAVGLSDPFLPGDWQKLSLGLLCHGEFMACGSDKTDWLQVDDTAPVGAMTVVLKDAPWKWSVGDQVLIAGTDSLVGETQVKYQSEFHTLTAVDGRTLTLDSPLQYRHFKWRDDLRYHVANLSRNVVIRSRNPAVIESRGHLMFMTSMNDIRYTRIENLGRTDKSRPVTDPRKDASGNVVAGSADNPRARYADHNHRTGPLNPPSRRMWNVIDGSPGWGLVNHASNQETDNCIAVRCYGAGFVTEEGQERGYIHKCLGAMNHGQGDEISSSDADHGVAANGDWGTDGSGFWLQGGLVDVSDCVAFDNSGRGFGLFNRTLNGYPDFGTGNPIPAYLQYPIVVDQSLLPADYFQTPWWQYYVAHPPVQTSITSQLVPQRVFSRNTAYGNKVGVQGWFGNGNNLYIASRLAMPLSVRGSITDLTLWGRGGKLHMEYARQFNINGLTICGDLGFRSPSASISKLAEAVLLRGDEMTINRWNIQNMACQNFHIEGSPTPVNIQIENETVSGTTVTPN